MLIYKATNKINGKCYIGQTRQVLINRIYRHKHDSNNLCRCPYFHNAIKKYGFENFKWTILEICFDQDELNEKEQYYIKHFKSNSKTYGYNLDSGGGVGRKVTKRTRKKLSESHKGKPSNNKGRKMSDEQKLKLSIAHKGKKHSDEHKISISNGHKGIKCKEETKIKISKANKGRTHTEETKLLMSEKLKGLIPHNKGKKMSDQHKLKISNSLKKYFNKNVN